MNAFGLIPHLYHLHPSLLRSLVRLRFGAHAGGGSAAVTALGAAVELFLFVCVAVCLLAVHVPMSMLLQLPFILSPGVAAVGLLLQL